MIHTQANSHKAHENATKKPMVRDRAVLCYRNKTESNIAGALAICN